MAFSNNKILRAVVIPNPIKVMDNFIWRKITPNFFLYHKSVLCNHSPRIAKWMFGYRYKNITTFCLSGFFTEVRAISPTMCLDITKMAHRCSRVNKFATDRTSMLMSYFILSFDKFISYRLAIKAYNSRPRILAVKFLATYLANLWFKVFRMTSFITCSVSTARTTIFLVMHSRLKVCFALSTLFHTNMIPQIRGQCK